MPEPHAATTPPKPVMLVILDGWGAREATADNAVALARTPNFDRLAAAGPRGLLATCGRDVGLPDGQMGNSEVGHLNIGAGRVVMQELPRIDLALADGTLAASPVIASLAERLHATGGTCHLLGLVSDGGVHSHQNQAVGLARILRDRGVPVVLHAWTDGRDTPPDSARGFLAAVAASLPADVPIASVCGRYWAMDRDRRWDRVERAAALLVDAAAPRFPTVSAALDAAHARGTTDEFLEPAAIGGYAGMRDGDALLCFNFRADRVREILGALLAPDFDGFERPRRVRFAAAVTATRYSDALAPLTDVLFAPQSMRELLGETVAGHGLRQLRMAETEKYPHVTYFLNGGVETPLDGEDRIMVPSPSVATYDLQPEMSAPELAARAVEAIRSGTWDLVVLNFANPDMVGHTGVLEAAIRACETVDAGLGRIADAVRAAGGALVVTADHGNCEMMRDPGTGGPHTAHTLNRVPVLLASPIEGATLRDGRLADLAPTLLDLLGVGKPAAMTGHSLLVRPA